MFQNMVKWCFEEGGQFLDLHKELYGLVGLWGCQVGVESGACEGEIVGEGNGVGGPQAPAELA